MSRQSGTSNFRTKPSTRLSGSTFSICIVADTLSLSNPQKLSSKLSDRIFVPVQKNTFSSVSEECPHITCRDFKNFFSHFTPCSSRVTARLCLVVRFSPFRASYSMDEGVKSTRSWKYGEVHIMWLDSTELPTLMRERG